MTPGCNLAENPRAYRPYDGQRFIDRAHLVRLEPTRGIAQALAADRGQLLDQDPSGLAADFDRRLPRAHNPRQIGGVN